MSNTSAFQYIATLLWPFYINKLRIKSFHFHFFFTDQKNNIGYDVTTYLASFLFFACGQIFLWAGRGNHVSSSIPMTMIQIYTMCIPSFCISLHPNIYIAWWSMMMMRQLFLKPPCPSSRWPQMTQVLLFESRNSHTPVGYRPMDSLSFHNHIILINICQLKKVRPVMWK